ncbi:MAG: hypothetical protein ACREDG_06940, partial [Methylocella sp.]
MASFTPAPRGPIEILEGADLALALAQKAFSDALGFIDDIHRVSRQVGDLPPFESPSLGLPPRPATDLGLPSPPAEPPINLALPSVPQVGDAPTFDFTIPEIDISDFRPGPYTEATYVSPLLDTLKARIAALLDFTSTGLPEAIESALWNRAREREDGQWLEADAALGRSYAARGFFIPPGAMRAQALALRQAALGKKGELSREIAVNQATRMLENMRFATERGVQLEGILIDQANRLADRSLERQKIWASLLESSMRALETAARAYSARVDAYKAVTDSKIEVFKSQVQAAIDGARTQSELYRERVQAYSARVNAEGTRVEAETKTYEAVSRTELGVANIKLGAYQANVQRAVSAAGVLAET